MLDLHRCRRSAAIGLAALSLCACAFLVSSGIAFGQDLSDFERKQAKVMLEIVKDDLVSRVRSTLLISASHGRRWQGASTTNTGEYSEEKQRRQRRSGPSKSVMYF